MIQKLRSLIFVTIFFCLYIGITSDTFASENFTTDYDVIYTISETGKTKAQINVALTNKTNQYYASSYKIQVGFTRIDTIRASDPDGAIKPTVTQNEKGHLIELVFNKRVVGQGNTLPFTLTFETPDVAQKLGRIWEVNIPGITNQEDFDAFDVTVHVPRSFGTPTYIKPAQHTNKLTFTKRQLGTSGISLAFGDKQVYTLDLTYHLKNTNVFPIQTEIALPPSTNYQTIYLDTIEPKPLQVTVDDDGNWLASYRLLPSQKIDVVVKGNAVFSLTPTQDIRAMDVLKPYLVGKQYWDTTNPHIKKLAADLATAENIYDYVRQHLRYDFSRVTDNLPRRGAVAALQYPTSAVCLEFTDLFIAIARAANIPAREINGFAYTENETQRPLSLVKDILHAWPEYYDTEKQTWVMVDPTWGNTTGGVDYFHTFDFDHVAFVIKGKDSTYPVPAGGYKSKEDEDKRDVVVNFSETLPEERKQFSLGVQLPDIATAGLPIQGKLHITNTGNTLLEEQSLLITSYALTPGTQTITVPAIPPFGKREISFAFEKQPFLTNKAFDFTIRYADRAQHETITVQPFFIHQWPLIGGVIVGILALIICIIALRSRRI